MGRITPKESPRIDKGLEKSGIGPGSSSRFQATVHNSKQGCTIERLLENLLGTELLRELTWLKQIFGPSFDPTQYRMLLFGMAMVAMMVWRPRGLISKRDPSIVLHEKRAIGGDLVKEGHG